MWTRRQLKENGKGMFKRNYWNCVVAALIMSIIAGATGGAVSVGRGAGGAADDPIGFDPYHMGGMSPADQRNMVIAGTVIMAFVLVIAAAGTLLQIFVGNVLRVGGCRFFIFNRTGEGRLGNIVDPFRSGHYGNVALTMFLKDLFIGLWSLLLIVPGVIKSYEYRMVPYVLAENPGMDRKAAFAISKRMMEGQKWDTFVLDLSFLGWHLLSSLTCGLLSVFYVSPYVEATFTELYAFNKIKAYNEGYIR